MDLFHAITQEIENVISCHWLTEFRETSRSSSKTSRSASPSPSRSSSPEPSSSRRSNSNTGSVSSAVLSRSTSFADRSGAAMASNKTKMMDTEPGGEQTQYEGYKGLNEPHDKQTGQLGAGVPGTTEPQGVDAERGEKTADNIRYGQNISESGMGGMTTTTTGTANQEGGYGGTEAQSELEQGKNTRTAQQYSAKEGTHDYNVGG